MFKIEKLEIKTGKFSLQLLHVKFRLDIIGIKLNKCFNTDNN